MCMVTAHKLVTHQVLYLNVSIIIRKVSLLTVDRLLVLLLDLLLDSLSLSLLLFAASKNVQK